MASIKSSASLCLMTLILVATIFSGCSRKKEGLNSPEYNPLIAAYTSGTISSESVIQIRLSADYSGEINFQEPIAEEIFDFSPKIEGNAFWTSKNSIEFRPDEKLIQDQLYKVVFKAKKLFPEKSDVTDFKFQFSIIPLSFKVELTGLRTQSSTDLKWNEISGRILTTDKVSGAEVESILTAMQGGKKLTISWQHDKGALSHEFSIDSVLRTEKREIIEVNWDGSSLNSDDKGSQSFEVPGLNEFQLLSTKVIHQPEQYIELNFSDPIKTDQYLNGLLSLSNNSDLRFSVEQNYIRIYPAIRQSGSLDLNIFPGIKNILGYPFNEQKSLTLNFEEIKPEIRMIGQGVIMPGSEGLIFPFEAVNLKAVEVKVVRIYENNILQFLQVNTLSGDNELWRAGRLIAKKTISLTSTRAINYGEWNAFAIDLGDLIDAEPGAIYHIELSFKKKHSLYSCGEESTESAENLTETSENENEITDRDLYVYDSQYEYYGYSDYDYYDYEWEERDNPCSDSYYSGNRKVSRNILSSNLGIIVKEGNDKSILVAVTDILTTKPISGVKIEIYNFQQQVIATGETDGDGFAELQTNSKPFVLVAKKDDEKGYLKLFDGASLSLSQFEVSGSSVNNGIKGFIYGERGVWRPGDSLFLNFILEDKENKLPDNHPVSFELIDSRGKSFKKETVNAGLNGLYCFKTATYPDSPTGNWSLDVNVGALSFSYRVRIETVKPNRLKINLEFSNEELYSQSIKNKAKLKVAWLHGAPASNLEARVSASLFTTETTFKGFEEFTFIDPSKSFSPGETEVFNSNLDENGLATFTPEFYVKGNSPGKLRVVFTSRCFEKGGDFSIDQFSIPYSPYEAYLGLKSPSGDQWGMLVTDTLQNFEIVCLDEYGKPADIKNVDVSVVKLNWNWWWHSSGDNLASYIGSAYEKPVFQKTLDTQGGKAKFSFKISYPEWGRYYVRVSDPEGLHSSGMIVYFDWPGEQTRSSRNDPQSANLLVLSSDKKKYEVGETASITIPSGNSGRVLISIENGTKVLEHTWIESKGEKTIYSFPVTSEMSPNIYVNASLIQEHGRVKNDAPIRMYGVIPVFVEDKESHLYPEISMPDILRPESEVEITVSEKNAKKMTYTLAIVDEGLLDLTRFKTPSPWEHFYAKEALGVSTFDIYDWVIGAFGGRIDGVFSIGGGEEGDAKAQAKANRFPPMVKFIGPFELKEGAKNKHKIQIPNYVGSVKIMVVAANMGAYGNAEKVCPVRKPLMVLTTLPRVLGPGETVSIPVTVFAMEDQIKKVKVTLESNELFTIEESEKTIEFSGIGDKTIEFSATIKQKIGIGKISAVAKSGKEESRAETELEIRSPNPEITQQYYGALQPGESWDKQFNLPGIAGTNKADLEVSSLPPIDFGRRLKYLIEYPYGCMEQVTSSVFPQLYISDLMETNQSVKDNCDRNVKVGIQKLISLQLPSGGMGLWPNSTSENDWGTSYAGHFMLEAQKKGYSIPKEWLKKWIRYQKTIAQSWSGSKYESIWHQKSLELTQSYRLYSLALAGEPELGAMNRLREKANLDVSAKWQLAAAYSLAGQDKTALELISSLTTEIPIYTDTRYTYGSELRDKGFILQTLSLLNKKEEAVPVMQYISEKLSSEGWYSTQTTAVCLMAVSQFAGSESTSKGLDYDFSILNGEKKHAASNNSFSQIPIKFENEKSGKVFVKNTGKGILFTRLSVHGIPVAGEEKNQTQNLVIEVKYKDLSGNPINVESLEQGFDFIAEVKVYNPGSFGYYQNLALTQIFPSGWEIQNERLFESNATTEKNVPDYQDIRDDRVYSFFSLSSGEANVFSVKLNAAYKGKFYLPGILCEEMYRGDVRAMVAGKWVEVR